MKNEKSIDRIIQVNDTNIGKNIAELRKAMNIKQTDMVAKLQTNGVDISVYSYNRIEKGTQNPTVLFLYTCCHILGCDMNRIFDYKSDCLSEEKDYSQQTKLKTIISDETGLSIEAINAITRMTGTEHSYINHEYESEKYRRILNTLLASKEFSNFIKALAELEESHQKKFHHSSLQEIFTLILNKMYPISN